MGEMLKQKALPLLISLIFTGCATQKIIVKSEDQGAAPNFIKQQSFFFWGLGQEKPFDAKALCWGTNKDVVRLDVEQSTSDAVLSVITLGVYTPRTVKIYCK